MSNQVILWFMFIVPWLSLFFMKQEDIKRFTPVALLSTVLSIFIVDVGIRYGLWVIREMTYPFALMPSYVYSLGIYAMWFLKYTYGRFWLYLLVDSIINFVFIFFILAWFDSRGLLDFNTPLVGFAIIIAQSIVLYRFQMWQEGIFFRAENKSVSSILQPVLTKPLPKDEEER